MRRPYRQWPACRQCGRQTVNTGQICGPCSVPLDERLHYALLDAGFDEGDAETGTKAVLAVLAKNDPEADHG